MRSRTEHGELVLPNQVGLGDRARVDPAGGVEAIDDGEVGLEDAPSDRPIQQRRLRRLMLGGVDAEVRGLDAERGVVRQHQRRTVRSLPERGADDPVVGAGGVESVLVQEVLLDAVDLDLHRARPDRDGVGERAAVLDAQLLDRAQRGARRPTDVVAARLQTVEFLDDGEGDDQGDIADRLGHRRIGDQHRRVDDDPGDGPPRTVGALRRRQVPRLDVGEQVGHVHL